MVDGVKKIQVLAYVIAGLCVLGIMREIYLQNPEETIDIQKNAGNQTVSLGAESLGLNTKKKRSATPKAIMIRVDDLLKKARQAKDKKDYNSMVDFYYDAVLLEPEIFAKWNKKRYIGAEMEIIKKIRKTHYLPHRKSTPAKDKLSKIDHLLSELYKGCKN